jgi:hypothetical protein
VNKKKFPKKINKKIKIKIKLAKLSEKSGYPSSTIHGSSQYLDIGVN